MPHSLKVTLGRFRSRVEQRAPEEGKATARGFTKTSSWKAAKDGQRSSNGTLGLCSSVQDTPVREGGTAPLPLNTIGLGWRVGSVWGCSLISSFIQQTFTDSLLGPALAQQKKDPSFEACTGAVSIMEKGLGCRHVSPSSTMQQFCDFMQGFLNSPCLYFPTGKMGMMIVPTPPMPGDKLIMHTCAHTHL